ncbi:RNA polymerase sigma factor [Rhodopirellula sp. MGV]|uniref:RNA polymerase sigma factor n=1 Tax=Rhodopirellula sp. MGV TaxID=2023130 RepID=UPI000B96AE73|nr:sigma-70 family RNA polymerase sigma factor [Rhodopirellula sp. MGV]OYP32311.1 RNA polymerase subunit sigma [Rhodopirellula sp. MGV]PNY35904.1 sigma-70 family RNA polymerase sigma factor [Rhodopirellula baltica]
MSLSEIDRILLQQCIDGAPRAWQDFVERFLGLVIHVANHTAQAKGIKLDESLRDDLVAEVFLVLISNDRGVLRRFRRNSSLATYLTVIARRVISRRLFDLVGNQEIEVDAGHQKIASLATRIENREEVERLLERLDPQESNVVRMYHLEGKSYHEISQVVGLAENSIGPLLTRARQKMREGA